MSAEPIVFVVDDDPAMRDSLKLLLEASGYATHTYESAVAFLASDSSDRIGCGALVLGSIKGLHTFRCYGCIIAEPVKVV